MNPPQGKLQPWQEQMLAHISSLAPNTRIVIYAPRNFGRRAAAEAFDRHMAVMRGAR